MGNEDKKAIVSVLIIIVILLILGGFYYSYKKNKAGKEVFDPATESTRGNDADVVQTVDVKHQYKNGIHTFAGEISLPTPCDSVEVVAEKDSMNPANVSLNFTSSNIDEVCTQVITARKFKTSFEGQEDIQVIGTLNRREIKINLFEVPQNENLDVYEVNIKG